MDGEWHLWDGAGNLVQVTRKLKAVRRRLGFETPCPLFAGGRSRR